MSVSNTIDADLDAEFRFSEENYLHLICPRTKKVCISCSEVALESTIERVGREGLEPRRASILAKGGFKEALQFLEGVKPYWMVERFDVDSDPDGIPYITFPVGGVFSALERVYAKRYPSTQPPLIIARLSIKPHYIDSMYMMPVPIAGHTQNAAVAFSSYTPRTYTLGGHDTKKARQLTRQLVGSKTHMSQENPFAPKPKKLVGEIGKTDNGLSAAARSGQLGTR